MKSATELRKKMLDYMFDYTPILTRVLGEWNEKMQHGIPLPRELWYDTFGKQVEKAIEDTPIDNGETDDEKFLLVFAGVWVNPDNPYEVVFSYKVKVSNEGTAFFKIGEEDALIDYCKERGC